MKRAAVVLAAIVLSAFAAHGAPPQPDDVLGYWTTETQEAIFEIFKEGDTYHGRILWLREPVYPPGDPEAGVKKHDRHNPDESLRDTPMLNYVFLKHFTFKADKWAGGTIYDPLEGKTYKSQLRLKDGVLNVRGYIGLPVLGRTVQWSRPSAELLALKEQADTAR